MTFVRQVRPALPTPVTLVIPTPSITATYLTDAFVVPSDRTLHVTRAHFVNATGLAVNTSNYFVMNVQNAASVIGALSTHDTALTAGVGSDDLTLTDANAYVAAGAALRLNFVLTGSQTLPVGTAIIEGFLL